MIFVSLIPEIMSFFLLIFVFFIGLIYRNFFFKLDMYVYLLLCSLGSIFLLYNNLVGYTSFFFLNVEFFSVLVILVVLFISFFIFPYLLQYNQRFMFWLYEFSLLFLFMIFSVIFMMQTYYLLLFFLFFEIHNICLYILIPFSKNNGNFVESGLKYFILSSFCSIIMLLGISFLYYSFGTLDLLQIESIFFISSISNILFLKDFGFIFLLLGFLFKLYCVPFHFWVSDIYHGSPSSTTVLLACISYCGVLVVFFMFFFNLRFIWIGDIQNFLFIFIIFCLLIGGIGGLFQKQFKRLIAYSSISGLGYVLYGFIDKNEVLYVDAFFYFFVYLISLIGIFLLLFGIEENLYVPARLSLEVSNIESFSGLFYVNKYYTLLFTFLFFSVSGIPPFIGFYSKYLIFEQAIYNVNLMIFICMFINSLSSCYFYFYFIKVLYYDNQSVGEIKLIRCNFSNIYFFVFWIVFFLVSHVFVLGEWSSVFFYSDNFLYLNIPDKFLFVAQTLEEQYVQLLNECVSCARCTTCSACSTC
jgi:NADH-quinone oxidoreductase subunit N